MSGPPWRPPPLRRRSDSSDLPPPPPRRRRPHKIAIARDGISLVLGSAVSIYEVFIRVGDLRPEVLLFATALIGVPLIGRIDQDPPP